MQENTSPPLIFQQYAYFILSSPQQIHHHFTPQALIGVLKKASQKRRRDRDDRITVTREVKEEVSRSESQSSEAPMNRTSGQGAMNSEWNKLII